MINHKRARNLFSGKIPELNDQDNVPIQDKPADMYSALRVYQYHLQHACQNNLNVIITKQIQILR